MIFLYRTRRQFAFSNQIFRSFLPLQNRISRLCPCFRLFLKLFETALLLCFINFPLKLCWFLPAITSIYCFVWFECILLKAIFNFFEFHENMIFGDKLNNSIFSINIRLFADFLCAFPSILSWKHWFHVEILLFIIQIRSCVVPTAATNKKMLKQTNDFSKLNTHTLVCSS